METCTELGKVEAQLALDACVGELRRRGKAGVVAVADSHGELLALLRIDGTPGPSIVIAQNKTDTAARARRPSGDLGRSAQRHGSDVHFHGGARYVGWNAGAPVVHDGRCPGSVGASGVSGKEDLEIRQPGIDAVLASLAA